MSRNKSTINLSDVLSKLSSPMEKVAAMSEGKTDELESKAAEVGKEEPATGKAKADESAKDSKEKSSEELEKEKKEAELEKSAAIKVSAAKVAAGTPVSGLEKIAQDLAEVEHRTMIKEAQVFGSVMADSFAGRLAEIQNVINNSDTPSYEKTAMEKTAARDDYMTKVATELYVNMDQKDQVLVYELVKTAAENGMHISPEEAFSALADQSIIMGEQAAFEKIATAEVMTKLAGYDHAKLDGFTKTAALMGETVSKEEAFHYLAKTAMAQGAAAAQKINPVEKRASVEKTAEEQSMEELNAMEKVAADLGAKGDKVGVAKLEKYAYEKGFEETLLKVASHTSGIGYEQTRNLME